MNTSEAKKVPYLNLCLPVGYSRWIVFVRYSQKNGKTKFNKILQKASWYNQD